LVSFKELSDDLSYLVGLSSPPIAVSFAETCPKGAVRPEKPIEACALWGKARDHIVCATPSDHSLCWLGIYAMGCELSPELRVQKEREITGFAKFRIMSRTAFASFLSRVPVLEGKKWKFVIYQSLESVKKLPDLVLLSCKPEQALTLTESMAYENGEASPVQTNLPGCAIIPAVANQEKIILSLGCGGSRKLFPIRPDEILVGVPGKMLTAAIKNMRANIDGNKKLIKYMGWK